MLSAMQAATALSSMRGAVGLASWLAPGAVWPAVGLGGMAGSPSAGVVTRLFGVRDLALGAAVRHPDPAVRRTALQAGVAIDAVDVVAGLVAARRGAPRASLLGVTAGAALFVGLGLRALQDDAR